MSLTPYRSSDFSVHRFDTIPDYVSGIAKLYGDAPALSWFTRKKEEKTLKNFARVKILVKGEAVYDELLANALKDENISFSVDFGEDKNTELTVVYYLPIEVGNEAKNAEAIFELLITASNEEGGEG